MSHCGQKVKFWSQLTRAHSATCSAVFTLPVKFGWTSVVFSFFNFNLDVRLDSQSSLRCLKVAAFYGHTKKQAPTQNDWPTHNTQAQWGHDEPAVCAHFVDRGHSFEDSDVHILDREEWKRPWKIQLLKQRRWPRVSSTPRGCWLNPGSSTITHNLETGDNDSLHTRRHFTSDNDRNTESNELCQRLLKPFITGRKGRSVSKEAFGREAKHVQEAREEEIQKPYYKHSSLNCRLCILDTTGNHWGRKLYYCV